MQHLYKNHFSELKQIAQDVEVFAAQYQLDIKTLYVLNLCIEEAFTNTVSYGFDDELEHIIRLTLTISKDRAIEICIIDDGKPFDPLTQIPPPRLDSDLQSRSVGGLGIFFIKEMMDEVKYQRIDSCNHLKMVKHIDDSA